MMRLENLLIISGNGRNTGKTSFACRVISTVKDNYTVTAVKVSPHFHEKKGKDEAFIINKNFTITLETDPWRSKDSSRMIAAGAQKVYYIEVTDSHLQDAFDELMPLLPEEGPIVCESGGLRNLIEPSMFIMLNEFGREELKEGFKKLSPLADKIVLFEGSNFDYSPEKIKFNGNKWTTS